VAARFARDAGAEHPQFYTRTLNERSQRKYAIEAQLRQALERDEFSVFLQPKIDLSSSSVVGMEALIRWRNEELGELQPDQFIGIAESSGLIVSIGEWVMREACEMLATLRQQINANLTMAVNLSPLQLRSPELTTTVETIINSAAVPFDAIEFEITEGALMSDPQLSVQQINAFRELGIVTSVDDFGTGYSSLSYLTSLPIDKLKIDKSFVHTLTSNTDSAAIVNAIVSLGHNLGLAVVGEGVETRDQLTFLRAYGCDEAQGFLFAKPMPMAKLKYWLTQATDRGAALTDVWSWQSDETVANSDRGQRLQVS